MTHPYGYHSLCHSELSQWHKDKMVTTWGMRGYVWAQQGGLVLIKTSVSVATTECPPNLPNGQINTAPPFGILPQGRGWNQAAISARLTSLDHFHHGKGGILFSLEYTITNSVDLSFLPVTFLWISLSTNLQNALFSTVEHKRALTLTKLFDSKWSTVMGLWWWEALILPCVPSLMRWCNDLLKC